MTWAQLIKRLSLAINKKNLAKAEHGFKVAPSKRDLLNTRVRLNEISTAQIPTLANYVEIWGQFLKSSTKLYSVLELSLKV